MPGVIALDAMGSDRAPKPEIEGAIQAARRFGIPVILVGPVETLRAELLALEIRVAEMQRSPAAE